MIDATRALPSRREVVLAAAGASVPPGPAAGSSLYEKVRGFNYQPSYSSHGFGIWTQFDARTIEKEIHRGRRFFPRINTLRIWLSWDAFLGIKGRFTQNFGKLLSILERYDLRAIVTLFNAWHALPDFGGITSNYLRKWRRNPKIWTPPMEDYLKAVVGGHSDDPRVLLWDLCNEPSDSGTDVEWLQWLYDTCKLMGAKAPITVGNVGSLQEIQITAAVSDVLSFHPYLHGIDRDTHRRRLDECVAFARKTGKPLLATECCWGSMDDKIRAENVRQQLEDLSRRRIGFLPHLLHHTLVADGHRPEYGYLSPAEYMAFIERDGRLRPYHEVFNEFC